MEQKHEDNPSFWNGVRHGGEHRSKHPSHTQVSGRAGGCHRHLGAFGVAFESQWYRIMVALSTSTRSCQLRVSIDCAPSDLCIFASIVPGGKLPYLFWKRLAILGKGCGGSVKLDTLLQARMTNKVLLCLAGPRFFERT